jgi:hypothetical protein
VVGIANREIEPDHVVRERHPRIERGGAGVIGKLRVDPADAGCARLLDRDGGGAAHHEMTHAVVAVDKRGRGLLTHHADVWFGIEAAGPDAAGILRQPADAVAVGALKVRLAISAATTAASASGRPSLTIAAWMKACSFSSLTVITSGLRMP